ncbi:MAG: AAA family ATPase [Polyangiaceae bacterium]|nr:AAA family ATPase [Polyangiaceae bacterium]
MSWEEAIGKNRKRPEPANDSTPRAKAVDGGTPYGRAALERECSAVASAAEGERNNQLNTSAFSVAQLVSGGQLGEAEARAALHHAAKQCGLGDGEIRATLNSAFGAGEKQPRQAPPRAERPHTNGRGTNGSAHDSDDAPESGEASTEEESAETATLIAEILELIEQKEWPKAAALLLLLERQKPMELPAIWLSSLDLATEPPKRRWLFNDVRSGKPVPLLRRGKVFVLAADGGVGKSFIALLMAVCLGLGRKLFDAFQPEVNCGRIALLMGEDDAEECQDRLYRICNALGLGAEERLQVQEKILLFLLTGHEVSFLSVDQAHNPRRTEFLEAIVQRLNDEAEKGGFEWAFVAIDPLARFASGNAESDNGLATAFVQAVESIAIRVTGEPGVMVTHHSSKTSGRAGGADVRGVTGLRNGFRAAFTLSKVRTAELQGVLLENSKNNLAPEADPLWLVRMQDEQLPGGGWLRTSGVLRAATPEEAEELRAASGLREHASPEVKAEAKQARVQVGFRADCDLVESLLPEQPNTFSRGALEVALEKRGHKWGAHRILNTMAELLETGRAVDLSDGRQRSARQWAKAEVQS